MISGYETRKTGPLPASLRSVRLLARGVVPLALASTLSLACATAYSGTSQELEIRVLPGDAMIAVYQLDGELLAGPYPATAGKVTLPRPKTGVPYLFLFSRSGYCPAYKIGRVIESEGASFFAGTGGAISLLIDHESGGGYAIEVHSLRTILEPEEQCNGEP